MLDQIIQLFIGHHLNARLKSYFTLFIVTCICLSGHYQMETFLCHLKPFNSLKTKKPHHFSLQEKGQELQRTSESNREHLNANTGSLLPSTSAVPCLESRAHLDGCLPGGPRLGERLSSSCRGHVLTSSSADGVLSNAESQRVGVLEGHWLLVSDLYSWL